MSSPSLCLLNLPTELLIEICWQSDNSNLPIVCSYLRDVIYSTPSFWTSAYIGEKQYTPEAASFLSQRLERGVTCPLDVVIRASKIFEALAVELCLALSTHRDRIRTLGIRTDTVILCGTILHTVLLTPPTPLTLPSLHKLDYRHDDDGRVFYPNPMDPQIILNPIPSLLPTLTTLVLPLLRPCIPYLESPIPSLKTLVLDGSMEWTCDYPSLLEIAQLLAQTPQLETFWCKEHRAHTYETLSSLRIPPSKFFDKVRVNFPVLLPRLTKMAVVVPGIGINLLHAIDAPALRDLHMDGIKDEDHFDDEDVQWLNWFPDELRSALQVTASRSLELRRLSFVGAYLARDTWEWLLGCGEVSDVPFPLLDSIAVRETEEVKGEVINAMDESLIELYAKHGRVLLRRFAYLSSDPPLRGFALHQLINGVAFKKAPPDHIFELEIDGVFGVDTKERLQNLLSKGVRVILHEKPPQRKSWWTSGDEIDPSEADSY